LKGQGFRLPLDERQIQEMAPTVTGSL